ncbi:MAG: LuxR C-terminal-related transcriptional regulator [Spirochaetaceae bacterium]|nr:LuxR C-terminal-related transcriptional regulator [Spirochaetaceae bacterium]
MDKPTVELLARAIRDSGTPAGPRSLLSFVGALVPFTSSLVTLLARGGRPVLLYDDIRPERREIVVGAYLRGAYLLDPFYDYLLAGPRERVVPLQDIQPDHFRKSRYFSSYYADVGLADEIGMFATRRDGSHIFASIGRAYGMEAFSKKGIDRLRHFQPVIEHLMERQWDAARLGADGGGSHGPPSFLTLDEALRRGVFRSLSAREREIVALILKGHSSKSIAAQLGIAVGTVKNHRKSIYRRLSISSQSALFARFLRSIGYVPQESPER